MSDQNRDTRYNKNPLLSASVTGLTFDDFTNKAILLPAAALPTKIPEHTNTKDTETAGIPVIFGSEPAVLDTETFSEISLDQSSDLEPYSTAPNPLQDDQVTTENSRIFNPLTQATQLKASLSQLPSVASSVFSSFSSILRGTSPTPTTEQQQHIEPYNVLPASQLDEGPFIDNCYQVKEAPSPIVTPIFYSANDATFLPSASATSPPPSNVTSGNAYRLTTKKKLYAPAPGLTHIQDAQVIPTSSFPFNAPQLNTEPQYQANPLSQLDNSTSQSTAQGNQFSLTSFFSPPIIDKSTGSGSQAQEPQRIVSSDIFAVPSTTTPTTSVNFINPNLFVTNPVASANKQNSFNPEQQPLQTQPLVAAPILFSPNQSTSSVADLSNQATLHLDHPVKTIQSTFPTVSAAVPTFPSVSATAPNRIPPSGPPSGNISNYRLRGKPHYKNSLSSTTASTFILPYSEVIPNTNPSVGIFNPGQPDIRIANQEQVLSPTTNLTQYTQSTVVSQTTQQSSPAIAFFKEPETHSSLSDSQNSFNENSINRNQLPSTVWNNSGNSALGKQTPITFTDQVLKSDQTLESCQVQQLHQQQSGQFQPFFQSEELGSVQEHSSLQRSDLLQESGLEQLQQRGPFQPFFQSDELESAQEHSSFQRSDLVQAPGLQQSQLLQLGQIEQLGLGQEQSQLQSPDQLQQVPHLLEQTGQLSQVQQQIYSQQQPPPPPPSYIPSYPTSAYDSNSATVGSHQNIETTGASADFYCQTENQSSNLYPHQVSNSRSSEFSLSTCLSSNKQEDKEVETVLSQNISVSELSQSIDDTNFANSDQRINEANIERTNSTITDNFFDQKAQSRHTFSNSEPQVDEQQQPIAAPISATTFFDTSSNSSPPDWFNPLKATDEGQIVQGNINNNKIPTSNIETIEASTFFNDNNNQTNLSNSPQPNYFQIQNFFNNPPLIADGNQQDRNFNFIENNLINKRLHNLTQKGSIETDGGSILSNLSNVVEPPSSAQSELSEFAEINTELTTQSDDFIVEQQTSVESKNMANMSNVRDQSDCPSSSAPEISNVVYRPVYKHWFFNKVSSDLKASWTPFPMSDSLQLEDAFIAQSNQFVTTNGGRYDVNIELRTRSPIYWNGTSDEVRRCSWFYKGSDSRLVPYDEDVSDLLEEEYKVASQSGDWNRKLVIPSGETVVFQAPSIMVHFLASQTPDVWPNTSVPPANRPRIVKRGVDEFNIEDGEPDQVDHLLFMVHGIGAGCDLKFRSVEEVVEDFRAIALQLTQSHYRSSCDHGEVGRIEILPVSWHAELHSEESGIDEKLKAITLESIPKLRSFTNDTLLDILFYSSPVFCQKIMDTVAGTINRMYMKYCERNPHFKGNVSLAGHSLGSLILFDLLQNQKGSQLFDKQMDIDRTEMADKSDEGSGVRSHKPLSRTRSRKIDYTISTAGMGQPFINYPQLVFKPKKFFALGSPIGMFVTIRGVDTLGLNYKLPTTDGFYNIFHPYDPVAYRIEALVNSDLISSRPVLIPHHKGRKRMHLELRETVARVGADIKQKIIDTFKTIYNFASLQKTDPKSLEQEVDKVLEQQLALESPQSQRARTNSTSTTYSDFDNGETEFSLGVLNEGKRIDYVLQEAPLEFFNEYIFALTSHVCYWDSADTILFIVKEIYSSLGMQTDSQIPQQSMTIERPISVSSLTPSES